jgi:HrpA-like RNA helicase
MGAQVADEGPALVALAVTTLRLVCDDGEAPAAARAQAARTLLELVGALRDTRRGVSPAPAEMSPAELDQALARALAREGPGP